MSELGIVAGIDDNNTQSLLIITVISAVFFIVTVIKLIRFTVNLDLNLTNSLVLIIYCTILVIFVCIFYLVRAVWGIVTIFYTDLTSKLLDGISCVTLTLLGNFFTLL